ncbi:MAG: hypothetical protein EAZ11_11680 [Curvibacter sp.]|nr:MAG: hypothetical protein EAZ11_11680 [Curvibacter sp.]
MRPDVPLGHRTFIVEGDAITRLSQARCNAFILKNQPALPEYAGQTITLAFVGYELMNRKPSKIFLLQTSRHRVTEEGRQDFDFWRESADLQMQGVFLNRAKVLNADGVINAKVKFDLRRLESLRPKLSGLAHKRILEVLFGTV